MSESTGTTNNAHNEGRSVKEWIHTFGNGIPAAVGATAVSWVLARAFDPVKTLLGRFFWEVPMWIVVIISGSLIILGFIIGLIASDKKQKQKEKTKRGLRTTAWIAGMAGFFGLMFSGIGSIVTGDTPFRTIVLDNNNAAYISMVVPRNMSGIWLRIDGSPLNNDSGSLAFELLRRSPKAVTGEPLSVNGLKRDSTVIQSKYYFPKQGSFIAPGPLRAGDTLVFQTINESGFEGEISFELWEAPKGFETGSMAGLEGTIVFEPKKGAEPGTMPDNIADYEGKIILLPRETPEETLEKGAGE